MHPILFKLGPVELHTYGFLFVIAFLSVTWLAARGARTLPPAFVAIPAGSMADLTCVLLIGGLLGARLLYVVLQWDVYRRAPHEILAIWHGGLVWYGGFLGGIVACWLYARARRVSLLRVLDQFIPYLAIGHALGRIGCFLNGCCYGRPVDGCCGVVLPGHTQAVIPIQLYEALGLFLLYCLLRGLQRPTLLRRRGTVLSGYLIGYGLLRFSSEFLRGDQTVWWAGLTLPQLMSIGMVLIGLAIGMSAWRSAGDR